MANKVIKFPVNNDNIVTIPDQEVYIHIEFDLDELTEDQVEALFLIENLFTHKLKVTFDTGCDGKTRDWEWDESLSGPIKIYLIGGRNE